MENKTETTLVVQTYGPLAISWLDGGHIEIKSAKTRALLAMLVTAPSGKHAKAFLRKTLWAGAQPERRSASLRRAVSDLRAAFGDRFDMLFSTDTYSIGVNLEHVKLEGNQREGEFLEDLSIAEDAFEAWLRERRLSAMGTPAKRAGLLPNELKATVAVVPLLVVGCPPDVQEEARRFAEFFTAGLTRDMARCSEIDMISHLSARLKTLEAAELQEIRRTLDADYIVYGTLVLGDGQYSVDVDICTANDGILLWSGTTQGGVASAMEKRTSAISELAAQLCSQVYVGCVNQVQSLPLPQAPTNALLLSAVSLMHEARRDRFERSKLQLDHLIQRLPDQVLSRAWRALWHLEARRQNWGDNADSELRAARRSAADSLDLHPRSPTANAVNGFAYLARPGMLDEASEFFERALFTNPDFALAMIGDSYCKAARGDMEGAIETAKAAVAAARIRPYRYWYDAHYGQICLMAGADTEAINAANRALAVNRSKLLALTTRLIALHRLGRAEEALRAGRILMERHPSFSFSTYRDTIDTVDWPGFDEAENTLRALTSPNRLVENKRQAAE